MLLSLLFSSAALACGGLFCSPAVAPIDQAAEEILFALDDEAGTVEMHIAIQWEGKSEDFAWILPVPDEPEIFLSSATLFQGLQFQTNPSFQTRGDNKGRCGPIRLGCANDFALAESGRSYPSVTVVGEEQVGPYETVTLKADSSEALIGWLNEHDYDLPPNIEPLLAPYVAGDSHFVAMRLSATADTGDIEPIGLRFPGSTMSVPIQLTAVAAVDDMPIRIYVLADHRAVPDSYLHVEINEAAIDWIGGGSNYTQVLSAAIDTAGGQAFVTEYAGVAPPAGSFDTPLYDDLVAKHPYLTRLITTLSADEMTLDPTFAINANLPDVSNLHLATLERDCRGGGDDSAPMTLLLDDGRVVELGPSDYRGTSAKLVADLQDTPALFVHDLAGQTDALIADFSIDAQEDIDSHNAAQPTGCSCASAPFPASLFGVGLLVLIAGRRRRT